MKRDKGLHIRLKRFVMYLVVLGCATTAFYILRSYYLLAVLVFLFVLPLLSVVCVRTLSRSMEISIRTVEKEAVLGRPFAVEICLDQPTFLWGMDFEMMIRTVNCFFGNHGGMKMVMPVAAHGRETMRFMVQAELLGEYHIFVEQCRLQDVLGLFWTMPATQAQCRIAVVPPETQRQVQEGEQSSDGMAEQRENLQAGNDFSDVSNIREYIPGDRLRDIHWKISAKWDQLMVKERMNDLGERLMIAVQLYHDRAQTECVLETLFSTAEDFLRRGVPVCILVWHRQKGCFEEYPCDTERALCMAYAQMYAGGGLSDRLLKDVEGSIRSCYPALGAYLLVHQENEKSQNEIGAEVVMRDNV